MARIRWWLVAGLVLAIAWVSSAWYTAQDAPAARPAGAAGDRPAGTPTVEEALLRPCRIPFAQPTSLAAVADFLRGVVHGPVVLDRAALDRRGVTEEATVQLALDGVRLKTALGLLLDQVGLTYRVVPEDNLLVLTDGEGAQDPTLRILSELEALHRDVHDLQNAVDRLFEGGEPVEGGPALRAPTIIEELPEGEEGEKPEPPRHVPSRSRPG